MKNLIKFVLKNETKILCSCMWEFLITKQIAVENAENWTFFSLFQSRSFSLKHNSGIFTISLNKHLLLLNFVIIIKCSEIIVHEFSRFCVFAYGSTDSFPLPASFDCNYLCHIFTQLISSSRSRNASRNFRCWDILCIFIFTKINIHISVWSFSSFFIITELSGR